MSEPETLTLSPGDPAPDFDLADGDGRRWRLADLRGGRVILYFYPADDTPGCTTQACDFRDAQQDLTQAGYTVLGVSPQDEDSHRRFSGKYGLNFPLLVDEGVAVAQRYGAVRDGGGVKRSTFVIDEDGRILAGEYGVKAKEHVDRLRVELGISG